MEKKWWIIVIVVIILLVGLYLISQMNIFPLKVNKGGANLTSVECANMGGNVVNAELRNQGCNSQNDLLGQVIDMDCNCVCCKMSDITNINIKTETEAIAFAKTDKDLIDNVKNINVTYKANLAYDNKTWSVWVYEPAKQAIIYEINQSVDLYQPVLLYGMSFYYNGTLRNKKSYTCGFNNLDMCNINCKQDSDCKDYCGICVNKEENIQSLPNMGACAPPVGCKCVNNKCKEK